MVATKVYDMVTSRILSQLEQGNVPWRKPWSMAPGMRHHNATTSIPYRGINPLMLMMTAEELGYEDVRWLTYRQAAERGGQVRKGEKGTQIAFWKLQEVSKEDDSGETQVKRIPLLRHYTVFNVQQCDGLKLPSLAPPRDFNPVEDAERVIANMPQRPPMRYDGGDRAYYVPATDAIHLPVKASFHSNDEYYATTFHELSHSTGHKSRLDRFTGSGPGYFGCADYGKEELIAEFSAAFLCAETGITNTLDNSAAYIRGWADVIKRAPELVIHAAGKGQKAADFILGSHQPRAVTAGPHDASERSLDDKIAELYQ